MKINKDSNLQFIFDLSNALTTEVIKLDDSYISKINVPEEMVNCDVSSVLIKFMRFEIAENELCFFVSNANNEIIRYEDYDSAKKVAENIKNNFSKQLSFSIFRKTGLKFLPKKKASDNIPIKFIEIK